MGGASALLRCAMFRRAAMLVDFEAEDGQQVELRGRIAVYEPRGELQLVVESMQRLGAGALYEQFLRLKARLEAAGSVRSAAQAADCALAGCTGHRYLARPLRRCTTCWPACGVVRHRCG